MFQQVTMQKNEKPKIMVIGLDGATFDIINPLIQANQLPNLARLMENGAHGVLQSTIHPYSEQAWSAFMTGKNSGKHGIFSFTRRKEGSYEFELINDSHRKGKTLWRILSDYNKQVGIINVPITYPPEAVNGFLMSGLLSPGVHSGFTFPPELREELKENVGKYVISVPLQLQVQAKSASQKEKITAKFIKALHEMMDCRAKTAHYLLRKYPCDFFIVVFSAPDFAQHKLWEYLDKRHPKYLKYKDAIYDVYRKLDRIMGDIVKEVDEGTAVIVMSDHGSGTLRRIVWLNKWLSLEGFLTYKSCPSSTHHHSFVTRVMRRKILKSTVDFLRLYVPQPVRARLVDKFPYLRNKFILSLDYSGIDWSKTKAYSTSTVGNININLKGREPEGTVATEKEYEAVRNELIEKLEKLKDPKTGENILGKVYKREDLYHGDYLFNASDLILKWKRYDCLVDNSYKQGEEIITDFTSLSSSLNISGVHRMEGILVASGKGIRKKVELHGAKILDLAPSILYYLGVPIPQEMDGQILTELFTPEYLHSHPIQYQVQQEMWNQNHPAEGLELKEVASVKKRLERLGYL